MNSVLSADREDEARGDAQAGIGVFTIDPDLRAALKAFFDGRREIVEYHDGTLAGANAWASEAGNAPSVIIDIGETDDPVAGIRELAARGGGDFRIIAVGAINDVTLYRWLIEAGAADYLVKPLQPDLLEKALEGTATNAKATGAGKEKTRLIVVTGTRGGAGATTFAVNLAWSVAHRCNRTAALIDLDFSYGTVALALDLEPTHGLREIIENPERIDSLFVESAMARESEKLSVLSTEEPISDKIPVDPTSIGLLVEQLSEKFPCIVADLPRGLIPDHGDLLKRADTIVLVSEMTLAAIRDTVRLTTHIREIAPDADLIIVANKVGPGDRGEVAKPEFERGIRMNVDHMIPWDQKTVAEAANAGKPLATAGPASNINKAMEAACQALFSVDQEARRERGFRIGNFRIGGFALAALPKWLHRG